jgi:transaldolase
MNRLEELYALGQSVWLDFIERSMVQSGALQALVEAGVAGVTSNPTIFQQAIAKSDAYSNDVRRLAGEGLAPLPLFEALAVADIQAATAVLRPVFDRAGGHDGFVSLEVAPTLAHDTEGTVAEARRLHASVDRPNLLVKVPATPAGVEAIRRLTADGININVTLIFSLERYAAVMEAYMAGLEERLAAGLSVDRAASVASFFVSRVDANIDARLEALAREAEAKGDGAGAAHARSLQGKAALANAKLAYRLFEQTFAGPRWARLAAAGARPQRPLWASTSTKNPTYPDLIYVEPLMGPHTVNTMPPQTLEALRDHGAVATRVRDGVAEAESALAALAELGINMDEVTDFLEADGVQKFIDSFADLLATLERRARDLVAA